MKIELSNGQLKFWQWDTKQKVKVPEGVPTVHFKFGSSAVEFPVTDRWVDVPDELLQTGKDILLWTYDEDHTLDAARIPVEKRLKPADYVYTPTEIKTWETLDARIAALEAANVQPNWDQNDTSAADYVRGRTHYVGSKHDVRIINQTLGGFTPELGLIVGNTYRVAYDAGRGFIGDNEFVCKDLNDGKDGMNPDPYVGNADGNGGPNPYLIFDNNIKLHFTFAHVVTIVKWKIEGDFADVKTLDLKYIDPKLLERIEKLENGGGVAGVSSINGQTGAVEITAKGLGALTEDDLQSATDKALAQAKATGEFDGAPGAPGAPGNDGYSPTVTIEQTDTGATITATDKTGTTTATVKNGQDGAPGSPGQKGDDGLSINWRGEYVESTAYSKNDAVSYDGSAYIMVSNSVIGAVPGIDDDWQLMAQKGGTGAPGPAGAGLDVSGATVGQTVKISAVDENGVPTAWVPVDMASGEKWEKIIEIELTDAASLINIDRDAEGKPFTLKRVMMDCVINIDQTSPMTNAKVQLNGFTVCNNSQKSFSNRSVGYMAFYAELIPGSGAIVWQILQDNNFNWADGLQKMGYKYNKIWESNAITQLKIVPNDGQKNFGIAGTKINVIGVRA